MALVGTLKKRRQELPAQLLDMRARQVLSTTFAFTKDTMICSYVPKERKMVVLLSTKHRQPVVSEAAHQKPQVILDYNRCKGAVDNLDKVIGTYTCRRQTRRWPVTVFSRILDISTWNGFLVWTALNPGWEKKKKYRRRLFIVTLGKELIYPHMARRTRLPQADMARKRVMEAKAWAEQQPPAPQPTPAPQPPAVGLQPPIRQTRAAAKHAHAAAAAAAAAVVQTRGLCRTCPTAKRAKPGTSCTRCKRFVCKRCIQAIYCSECTI
ncbi:uncharacterized protein LOC125892038 isoform X1 [Epinephelus fuscoguttatus]|uniref:uncharacterized protein LOC125892038 isoform X1 n=1 Tax=Epinephelus fuscoguttatus TaxID=293821 RepID=UPI0020D19EDB|nr:uncharacterized protein LOC125892038 isoform X1 [Epinephelus fuscoguttatus]